jgi:hypothetical protein
MGFDLLDLLNPVKLIVDAATHKNKKKKHGPLPGNWHRGWTIRTADDAHRLIVSAGSGNAAAQGQLNAIRKAAASGDPVAMKVMTLFRPVARMVQANTGSPSTVARNLLQKRKTREQQVIKRQQEQLKAMRQAQIQRIQKGKLMAQAQQRIAAERAKGMAAVQAMQAQWDAEAIALEGKLAAAEKQLERQDLANSMREQLEAQAAQYEAEIERIESARALQASPPGAAPAVPPLAEDEAANVEPGDVEITEE